MYLRMDFTAVDNEALHQLIKVSAEKERRATLDVLHQLREVERRLLYAEYGYPSLFEYVVKELKYSEGAAQRRISAMRLLRSIPETEKGEIEKKISAGALSLSTMSRAQTFFRNEKPTDANEKLQLLSELEGKSAREVERELVSRSSEPQKLVPERVRAVSRELSELKLLVDEAFLAKV